MLSKSRRKVDLDRQVLVKDAVQFVLAGLVDLALLHEQRVLRVDKSRIEEKMTQVRLLKNYRLGDGYISIKQPCFIICRCCKTAGNTYSFVQAIVPKHYLDIACKDNLVCNADPDLLLLMVQTRL